MSDIAIVGIGNVLRLDDAIGLIIVRKLKDKLLNRQSSINECSRTFNENSKVHCFESQGDITALMEYFKTYHHVYIIDAMYSKKFKPGQVVVLNALSQKLHEAEFLTSSHAIGVTQAIELARVLKVLPKTLKILAISSRNFEIQMNGYEKNCLKTSKYMKKAVDKSLRILTDSINS